MNDTTSSSLDLIAQTKIKLTEELHKLEEQEAQLRQAQANDAFLDIINAINTFGTHFNVKQKSEITALVKEVTPPRKAPAKAKREAPIKYWLPHCGATWSGRGKLPKPFEAWIGTAAYTAWKAKHPDEKFPAFPG
ncbi:H-NS histone family protein [Xylella fastidiosa subsp. multiplex]|uniref:H-NS histone family protein n=1 Tax=Xylella fastidiosa TaxID=2371 RepID=UPI000038075B|nr:H-NS family nucleoid-associated regulatory protein [Xylella fastidiosa]KAJ4853655.1 H-NS histone family protein [Xylella fastidiosa subsp. multiplex]MDC6410747.1 H-NS histone family protein [Xylella fastidiosa subsp. multiplex]MDC6416428.1 H-NS histone family protein [Xylella fastidiosa subsp. multiplex]MDC6417341.1 H-NS histone family protein [Xylella fastidiosa subsp. multiplex]MDD0860501.1 H-NS histone family protein [Xylella fastidiosa subsp. multiplex]